MSMQTTVVSKNTFQRAVWKNGLGHTDQIGIHPLNADLRRADFLWRVSSARIEQASDFSLFPNHDRVIVILEGGGVKLTHHFPELNEEETVELPESEPYEFPGDVKSRCELLGGAVTDLSVFIRKGEVGARVECLRFEESEEVREYFPEGRWNFLFVNKGVLLLESPQGKFRVEKGDCVRIESIRPEDLVPVTLLAEELELQVITIALG